MAAFEVAKALIAKHFQSMQWYSQLPGDWTGPYPLATPIIDYYAILGPVNITIKSYGDSFFFPSLSRLWERQEGYRYDAITKGQVNDWPDDWIVIVDVGADPFIFSKRTEKVFFAHHGEGDWQTTFLFNNLEEMASCILILGSVVHEAANNFTNADFLINRRYYLEAEWQLAKFLLSEPRATNLLTQLEWASVAFRENQ
jgi:hypothetical protein